MYISTEPEYVKYIVIVYKVYHWKIGIKQKIQGYFPSQKCQNKFIHSVFV